MESAAPPIERLALAIAAAQAHDPFAPVTVLVASNYAALSLRRALGSGRVAPLRGLANVAFLTPADLAEVVASTAPAPERLTPVVLQAVVREQLRRGDHRAFAAVADHPSTAAALTAVYSDLRTLTGTAIERLAANDRSQSVLAFFDAVRRAVAELVDDGDVAAAATRAICGRKAVLGTVLSYQLDDLAPVLRDFVAALDTQVIATAGEHIPELTQIITAVDADDEVRCVVRHVIERIETGTPANRIGIFYTSPDPYARIVRDQVVAAGLPFTCPPVRRLGDTVAGRLIEALLAVEATELSRDSVMHLVMGLPIGVPATAWDRISREAGVVGGRADWERKLAAHMAKLALERDTLLSDEASEGRLARNARTRRLTNDLQAFVAYLADSCEAARDLVTWRDISRWLESTVDELLAASSTDDWPAPERAALDTVRAELLELAALDAVLPRPGFAEVVHTIVARLDIPAHSAGRFGEGVFFAPVQLARGIDLDAVYVVGAAEGWCPAARREDALIPDDQRVLTGGELPTRRERAAREHHAFLAALSCGSTVRVASYPRGDGRSGRSRLPSRWLLDMAREQLGEHLASTKLAALRHPLVLSYESYIDGVRRAPTLLNLADYDLRSLDRTHSDGADIASHHAVTADVALAAGIELLRARASSAFTRFDGAVGALAPSFRRTDVVSPSRLERWATCPMRYFLGDVLRLAEIERPEDIMSLSAIDRGSLVHQILEDFLREVIAGLPHEDDAYRLIDIALDVCSDYEARGLTGRPVLWEAEKNDIAVLLSEFLARHRELRSFARPTHAEFSFGFDDDAAAAVLTLPGGRELRFRGRIDRVDRRADGSALVLDYKTGRPSGHDYESDPFDAGRRLQLPVYAAAARQHLGAGGVQALYWYIGAADPLKGLLVTDGVLDSAGATVANIVEGIEAGVFPAVAQRWSTFRNTYEECSYCEFDRLCPRDRGVMWTAKSAVPDSPVEVFLRLGASPDDVAGDVIDDGSES